MVPNLPPNPSPPDATVSSARLLQTRLADSFALIMQWSAAMNERCPLAGVLAQMGQHTQAQSVVIYRLAAAAARPRLVARAMVGAAPDIQPAPSGSLADLLRERHPDSALPGSVWHLSELRDDPRFARTRAFRDWAQRPGVAEVALVVLAHDAGAMDILELTFAAMPVPHEVIRPEIVARTLADAWALRQRGLVSRLIAAQGHHQRALPGLTARAILAADNPYGLSRSEFRVCGLLGAGMKAREIARDLGLTEATIRTHLRNIYAKTASSGQVEVMSRLHHGGQALAVIGARAVNG